MRIAVVGGNLLGAATVADLALVQEHDERKFGNADRSGFHITLFERDARLGGNSLRSVVVDGVHVEVGTARTLPLTNGSFLADLAALANGERGTYAIAGRRFRIPGETCIPRGVAGAATPVRPWAMGSYGFLVRSFGAWDWASDEYILIHRGWAVLDTARKLFNNSMWRSVFLAMFFWSARRLSEAESFVARGNALTASFFFLVFAVLSPKYIVEMWQRQYTFWGSTIPMLVKHGITAGIARGSTIGFLKHMADVNKKNAATCSISVGALLVRTGLEPYVRGTGEDYVKKFQYEKSFVDYYMAPVVALANSGADMAGVNSLASHFAMLQGDFANSEVADRFAQITPDNATICGALVDAARANVKVDVKLNSAVERISLDSSDTTYTITYAGGQTAVFDGVVLCASPGEDEMRIETAVSSSLSELLGYDRDAAVGEELLGEPAATEAEEPENDAVAQDPGTELESCSHLAVVLGIASASFFRFNSEKLIPDVVQITHCQRCTQFERVREVSAEQNGIYVVHCGSDFESSGMLEEMFEDGAELKYYQPRGGSKYSLAAVPMNMALDYAMPYVVLGTRFVYAAATDRLSKHPELDAMSAINAASLFSVAVAWESGENEHGEANDGDGAEDEAVT